MKAIITRPDGTKIELEGLTDDITKAVQALTPAQLAWPGIPIREPWPQPFPYPGITWDITSDGTAGPKT